MDKETYKKVWTLPKCSDSSLLYSKLHGYYLDKFDQAGLENILEKQLAQGNTTVAVQTANSEEYNILVKSIDNNKESYHNLFSRFWTNYSCFNYSASLESNTITFTHP